MNREILEKVLFCKRQWYAENDYGKWQVGFEAATFSLIVFSFLGLIFASIAELVGISIIFAVILVLSIVGLGGGIACDYTRIAGFIIFSYMFFICAPIILLFAGWILLMQNINHNVNDISGLQVATIMMIVPTLAVGVLSAVIAFFTARGVSKK